MRIPKSPYLRYAIVVGLTCCALALSKLLEWVIAPNFFLPFLAVVLTSSWFLGKWPGVVATVLGAFAVQLFFVPPSYTLGLSNPTELLRLLTFIVSALVLVWLANAVSRNRMWLEATLNNIGDAVVVTDRGGCVSFLNPLAEAMTGWNVKDARKRHFSDVLNLQEEKTGNSIDAPVREILQEGRPILANTNKLLISRDGHKVWVEDSGSAIRDERGRVIGAILIFRDMTLRREQQDQVSQTQKMEAIGRLASGVAGDFNNLLTVITGYSEMLRNDLSEGDPMRFFADEIFAAADRAAGLSRQLLSLGRREGGRTESLEINSVITNMETMLQRLLGEGIDLVIVPSPGTGRVRADAAQIELVILNLAMNSRDAMPDGGKFVVEVSNLEVEDSSVEQRPGIEPGSYVMIAVSDTGVGMDAETRAHLFEPFFTTKAKGTASGLGLSIVYGIVQQAHGHINVFSQPGTGTIMEIYLPRDRAAVSSVMPMVAARKRKGSETILVADDEDGVRKLVHAVLATNGYNVLEASDGREALAAYEMSRAQIALVVTDVVMPHMTGLELGERLNALNPHLRVLYISGYRDSPIGGSGDERDRSFLHKPFTPDALLARVRELLDQPVAS